MDWNFNALDPTKYITDLDSAIQLNGALDVQQTNPSSKARRRIARACDQCNAVRTKCDGGAPCTRCGNRQLPCTYVRQQRRRGKPSGTRTGWLRQNHGSEDTTWSTVESRGINQVSQGQQEEDSGFDFSEVVHQAFTGGQGCEAAISGSIFPAHPQVEVEQNNSLFGFTPYENPSSNIVEQDQSPTVSGNQARRNGLSEEPSNTGLNGVSSLPRCSSSTSSPNQTSNDSEIKYPVLRPLLPYIGAICSNKIASDLLEGYFATSSDNILHPSSPYLVGFVFRKRSFLDSNNPRRCSPALLASMLWLSAQTTECHFFGDSPTLRPQLTQLLFDLTISLLEKRDTFSQAPNEAGAAYPETMDTRLRAGVDCLEPHPSVQSDVKHIVPTLDQVIAYMHLGVVISARESKPVGFRWWHTAFQLAKELNLNCEISNGPRIGHHRDQVWRDDHESPSSEGHMRDISSLASVSSKAAVDGEHLLESQLIEHREERRRTWWTLYIVDRHLAFSYNSPLALKDSECQNLLQPMDEITWQFGADSNIARDNQYVKSPSAGPPLRCSNLGMFDLFLPVASILGQVIEFHHAKSHPRLGTMASSEIVSTFYISAIKMQIDTLEESLTELRSVEDIEDTFSSKLQTIGIPTMNTNSPASETQLEKLIFKSKRNQERLFPSYGRFWINILKLLLYSKWDLLDMLSSASESWLTTPSSVSAIQYAVAAAGGLDQVLKIDYDLSFSPYFIGIWLLQGVFVPLVVAMEGRQHTSAEVLAACETFVRAHEICVVTLHTEYQRKIRNVIRWTLAGIARPSRQPTDDEAILQQNILNLYRWSGDGTGIGL